MSVALPPSMEAKEIGIKNLEGLWPRRLQTVNTAGMNTTTTGVLLIKADMKHTATSDKARKRSGLPLDNWVSLPPRAATKPLRIRAALKTNIAAIVTNAWLLKPSSNSLGLRIPRSPRMEIIIRPTISVRTRSVMKSTTVASRRI